MDEASKGARYTKESKNDTREVVTDREMQKRRKGRTFMGRKAIMFVLVGALILAMTAGAAFATGIVIKNGNSANNRLSGTAQNDIMHGRSGNDKLFGKGDGDRLFGNTGNDRLVGGNDGDRMEGGKGDDRINAGEPGRRDADRIFCGPGFDKVFNAIPTEDIIARSCEVVRR